MERKKKSKKQLVLGSVTLVLHVCGSVDGFGVSEVECGGMVSLTINDENTI